MYHLTNHVNGFHVRLSASMENIDIVCRSLEKFLKDSGLEGIKFDIVLGAREILNNSIIHGSGNNGSLTVQFSTCIQNDALLLEAIDEGPGFDYQSQAKDCGLDNTQGRGICILQTYFDNVRYQPPGNRVELEKKIGKYRKRTEILMTEISKEGDQAVIKLNHDIISTNVEELRKEFKQVLQEGINRICLDLEGVTYVDSMGLGLLVATHNSLQKNGHKLQLSNVSDDISRLLKEMRLDVHFGVS